MTGNVTDFSPDFSPKVAELRTEIEGLLWKNLNCVGQFCNLVLEVRTIEWESTICIGFMRFSCGTRLMDYKFSIVQI